MTSTTKTEKAPEKKHYAVCNAKIVTIYEGKRLVKTYRAGEELLGVPADGNHYRL